MQWVSRNLLLCRCQSISSSSASSTSSSGSEHGSRHGVVRCAYLQMEMITPICRKSRSWSSGGGGGAGGFGCDGGVGSWTTSTFVVKWKFGRQGARHITNLLPREVCILGVSKVYMGLSVAIPTYIEYNKGEAGRRGLCKFLNANSNSIKVNHQQPKRTVPYIEVGPGRRVCRVDFQMRIKNIYWPVLQPWAPTFETLCCGSGG